MALESRTKFSLTEAEASFANSTRLFRPNNRKDWAGRAKRDPRNKDRPEDEIKLWAPHDNFFHCYICNEPYKNWLEHLGVCKYRGKLPPEDQSYYCKRCKVFGSAFTHQCPIYHIPWSRDYNNPKDTPIYWSDQITKHEPIGRICFCGSRLRTKWGDQFCKIQCAHCTKTFGFVSHLKTFKELKTKYGVKRQKKTRTILPPKTKGTKGRTGRKMGSIRKKL